MGKYEKRLRDTEYRIRSSIRKRECAAAAKEDIKAESVAAQIEAATPGFTKPSKAKAGKVKKKSMPWHIIGKLLNTKDKRQILDAVRGETKKVFNRKRTED